MNRSSGRWSGLVAPRSLSFSAWRAGSLRSLVLRASRRSFSGAVVVASFACPRRAGRFAARWARRLRVVVLVRRAGPGLWDVSVPCMPPLVVDGARPRAVAVAGLSVAGFSLAVAGMNARMS
jgi:hypothetical protein